VGVNLLWCLPGQVGGSEEYLSRALGGLAEAAPDVELVLFVVPGFTTAHPDLARHGEVVAAPVSGMQRSVRVLAEHTWLAREVRRRDLDLVHHGGGTVPTTAGDAAVVLTVHDIQYSVFPEHFTLLKRAWLSRQVPVSLRRADYVTTPSAFVRDSLVSAHGVDPARVAVVPHGIPASFGTAVIDESALRARYDVPGPFLLYPAATYPHKNHLLLLDVMARLDHRPDLRLVLTGGAGLGEEAVRDAVVERGLRARVIRTGRVPDADRDALLVLADALVFPSRYEGFGAPTVEAMAVGTPVVAARATALPEVVGDAGLLLDPDDPEAWAAAVEQVLDDAGLRSRLVEAGHRRAGELTATHSAAALALAYREALAT
jgi:alpha-1,3-rhamnosyl/mannosyltransferase